jgi:hypothetical protein
MVKRTPALGAFHAVSLHEFVIPGAVALVCPESIIWAGNACDDPQNEDMFTIVRIPSVFRAVLLFWRFPANNARAFMKYDPFQKPVWPNRE